VTPDPPSPALPEPAESLFAVFERASIPLLLAGGWAVSHHGYARQTVDIDWICSRKNKELTLDLMRDIGFRDAFHGMATRFLRNNDPFFPPIDFLWVDSETFRMMSRTPERAGRHRKIPVIQLNHLLAMKIRALADNQARQGRDLLDIRFLLDNNPDTVSEEELRRLCEHYGPAEAYAMIKEYSP